MTPERWQRLEALFEAADALDGEARLAYLDRECAGDSALRAEVDALLRQAGRPGETLGAAFRLAAAGWVPEKQVETDRWIGTDVGAYRVIRELGRGGMGSVYYATHREFGRAAAVKFIRPGVLSEAVLRRFGLERKILANLDHPGIARFIDAGAMADTTPFLIMEHVEGVPITGYCTDRGLDTHARVALMRSVCAAVQHAHSKLVIHRDLKPGNILVTADGTTKLLDFGIAKLLSDDEAEGSPTQTIARALTLDYASPEQVRGEPLSTQTDIYSLGAVLFELLTDTRLHRFDSLTWGEMARRLEDPPPRPSSAAPGLRGLAGDLDNIVGKALEPETRQRYGSAEELSEDLRRYLEGHTVRARQASVGYRLRKFVGRNRLAAAAALLLLSTLVGGIVSTRLAQRRAEAEGARAQQRLEQVLQFANTFLFEVHDAVAELKGATPARQLLVRRALDHLDRLAAEAARDPAVQAHLAAGYEKLSEIQYRDGGAHLGDSAAALASVGKALRLREALARSSGDREALRAVAANYSRLAQIRSLTRDLGGAARDSREALELHEALWREAPSDPESRAGLARALTDGGEIKRKAGAAPEALPDLRRALELRDGLLAEQPRDPSRRRTVVTASLALADLYDLSGDPKSALATLERALSIARPLAAEHLDNAQYQTDVASVLNRIGHSLRQKGALEDALRTYRESEQIVAALAQADPANARIRRSIAIHGTNVALVMETLGDLAGAEGRLRRSLEVHARLEEQDPSSTQARDDLAYVHAALASLLLKRGELAAAGQHALQAVERRVRLLREDPANAESLYRLAGAHAILGEVRERLGNPRAACEAYRQAVESFRAVQGKVAVRDDRFLSAVRRLAGCS